jgi:2-keto-4-pentenoate hydratase/2-oxohepta-3-ene-1,7-dioic acid hydratase in catechol pathway
MLMPHPSAGDLILTGTPEGVSAIKHGDRVEASVLSADRGTVLSKGAWEVMQGK